MDHAEKISTYQYNISKNLSMEDFHSALQEGRGIAHEVR